MKSLYSKLEKDVSIEKPNPWTKNDKINILDPDVRECLFKDKDDFCNDNN